MWNLVLKTECAAAQVCWKVTTSGRFSTRLTTPVQQRTFFMRRGFYRRERILPMAELEFANMLSFYDGDILIPAREIFCCVLEPWGAVVLGHSDESQVKSCAETIQACISDYDLLDSVDSIRVVPAATLLRERRASQRRMDKLVAEYKASKRERRLRNTATRQHVAITKE
jgi:hypothetical protein